MGANKKDAVRAMKNNFSITGDGVAHRRRFPKEFIESANKLIKANLANKAVVSARSELND